LFLVARTVSLSLLVGAAQKKRERRNKTPPIKTLLSVALSSDMHQGDQIVLSLRPGGGRGGGSRLFPLSTSSSSPFPPSADLPLSRPHESFSLKVRPFSSIHSLFPFLKNLLFGSRYTYPTVVVVVTSNIILYVGL